ncbi:hypothetical protein [Streptomyces sp. NPDC089799]|uniref:hypothetical protein n=1 Tax=Streptomyces sp. NPDC089799 TaxID=3155066 RepID=UPI00342998F4
MAEKQDGAGDRDTGRQRQRGPAFAALVGALIGAFAGLTGSMLAYFEARDTHRYEAQARRADIRRAAYVDLAGSTNKFVEQSSRLLNISLDPAESEGDRRRQFEDRYATANTDLARALATARLVTGRDDRPGLDDIETTSARVGEIATGWYTKGPAGADAKKIDAEFGEAVRQQLTALETFMDKAADESL